MTPRARRRRSEWHSVVVVVLVVVCCWLFVVVAGSSKQAWSYITWSVGGVQLACNDQLGKCSSLPWLSQMSLIVCCCCNSRCTPGFRVCLPLRGIDSFSLYQVRCCWCHIFPSMDFYYSSACATVFRVAGAI
ncbi:unnamed protein product [Polarella glacialis]|uniref:Uncharacterized protein n=1 Tax=Polarella glacialis TaxID=89957 RepID=A0A813KYS8_POLGL|nr:unnamed protein product [Polarella glacialis]|mmetsp:Transcript_68988/g.111180  ORF Transcript_68988/g.111180 Transcript_68988/m.111180 type:complete len:132 (+) Transcript_68988:278-673(+)